MSIFIASLAFDEEYIQIVSIMSVILASLIASLAGFIFYGVYARSKIIDAASPLLGRLCHRFRSCPPLALLLQNDYYMKNRVIYAMILLCMAGSASAQQSLKGQKEAGVRLGLPLGVTGRYFFTDRSAAEGIVGLYNKTFTVTALYQYHFDLSALTMEGFGWYAGGGAHLGTRDIDGSHHFLGGIDGVAGINYNFTPIP